MKSLEIVNEKIEEAICPRYTYTETIWDEEVIINKNELETIQQSLEVLEILRKKEVDIGFLKSILQDYSIEEALEIYNEYGRHLTLEELLKLKQWLEENENEK